VDTNFAANHSTERPRATRWRTALAVLISFALALSFFHGWQFDGDDGKPPISIAQPNCDAPVKNPSPANSAPPIHGDHCLAHMAGVAPQDTATTIEYVTRGYGFISMRAPDAADRGSPFKPPRA
jgi:hypothetical protein